MRIDSPTGANSWLEGNFKGKFKGHLQGQADSAFYAVSASYALTASTMGSEDFGKALNTALDDPANTEIFERLREIGRLHVTGGIYVEHGNVEIESGSLRIGRAIAEYLPDEDALQFRFGSLDPEPGPEPPEPEPEPTGSCPCCHCCHSGSCPWRPPMPPPPPPGPWPDPPAPTPCSCSHYSPSIDEWPGIGYQG